MQTIPASNTVMLDTILRSAICLNPVWGRAYEIVRLAEKLPPSIRRRGIIPSTAQAALEQAYRRASEVLAFNARRGS